MTYDITDENLLSLALADEDDDEDDEIWRRHIAVGVLIFIGAEQSRYERSERRQARRTYLVRSDLHWDDRRLPATLRAGTAEELEGCVNGGEMT